MQIFQEQCAVIADPELMKRVLSTNLANYAKDLDFSYAPFMVRFALCVSLLDVEIRVTSCLLRAFWVLGWSPATESYGRNNARR